MKMKYKNLDELIDSLDFLDVEIAATHLDYVNGNNVLYTIDAAKEGAKSWLKPYKKPQLLHHDKRKDAIGRVMGFTLEDTALEKTEPNNYIKLNVRITDKEAISKTLKGIYYTCSVGSSASRIRCSYCDQVLTVDGLCEHEKGSIIDGEKVYWIIDNISYRENSFVNNPADSYSRILNIKLGDESIDYNKFLEDKEELLTKFLLSDEEQNTSTISMEDSMKHNDAKLSTEKRNKLPDSAFCGPGRSFPAHDKAHVTAGLRLLNKSDFSQSTKDKIKACLYRKGKRYGVQPQKDELEQNSEILIYRMNDDFTEEEIDSVKKFIDEFGDADQNLSDEDFDQTDSEKTDSEETDSEENTYTIDDAEQIKKGKKEDLINFIDFVLKEYNELNDKIDNLNTEIETLNDSISKKDTILNSKESEIHNLLDENAKLTVEYKRSVVSNILDLKQIDSEFYDEEFKKYESRQIDSLLDTISDLKAESINDIPKIDDETLKDSQESDNNDSESNNTQTIEDNSKESKIDRFFRKNIIPMED